MQHKLQEREKSFLGVELQRKTRLLRHQKKSKVDFSKIQLQTDADFKHRKYDKMCKGGSGKEYKYRVEVQYLARQIKRDESKNIEEGQLHYKCILEETEIVNPFTSKDAMPDQSNPLLDQDYLPNVADENIGELASDAMLDTSQSWSVMGDVL
ncbi:hypothetical protein M501DRAFT_482197 [Patellaria atrata CBS 101060]|uniref:Uncharacterized protein n=1 Tax=Patellaria atrata CBS 101060 TaxID=1346257 RepID=A0A9P4VKW0_9PEZI|nr:hypothetical protein M501DRAFT_482197 [Patellaria atrata CBS 101060]